MPISYEATVTADASTASTASPWFSLNQFPDSFNVGVGVVVTAVPAYRVEATFQQPASAKDDSVDVMTVPGFSSTTATVAAMPVPAVAIRLVVASAANPPAAATIFVHQTGH